MTVSYAFGETRTSAVSRTCTNRKKKVSTPVIRWATHDHMPRSPRYRRPFASGASARSGASAAEAVVLAMVEGLQPRWWTDGPRSGTRVTGPRIAVVPTRRWVRPETGHELGP